MRKIDEIIIHCSATRAGKNFGVADIDRWHKERGFRCIGYHYVVLLNGTVCNGRPRLQQHLRTENRRADFRAQCAATHSNQKRVFDLGGETAATLISAKPNFCVASEFRRGAHCKGHNKNSIGICYVGGLDADGKPQDTRTHSQRTALRKLLVELHAQYPNARICGHRDFANKACPCFDATAEYQDI